MIQKYRKKPVVIEAVQWVSSNIAEVEDFVGKNLKTEWIGGAGYEAGVTPPLIDLIIPTLEGDMRASYGDYIIKGVNGEFYPCKPDIFKKTYEKAGIYMFIGCYACIRHSFWAIGA